MNFKFSDTALDAEVASIKDAEARRDNGELLRLLAFYGEAHFAAHEAGDTEARADAQWLANRVYRAMRAVKAAEVAQAATVAAQRAGR